VDDPRHSPLRSDRQRLEDAKLAEPPSFYDEDEDDEGDGGSYADAFAALGDMAPTGASIGGLARATKTRFRWARVARPNR
jgi:hypothetical protein